MTFTLRIDIRQRVRHLRRDPRADDRQKLEKLRTALAPLLVEAQRLQVAAGVFQCPPRAPVQLSSHLVQEPGHPIEQPFDSRDPLAHWDAVVQDLDEAPTPAPAAAPTSAPRTRSTDAILVEEQIICLPSNRNVTGHNDGVELILRQTQAKFHLGQLRELISEKSFLYSDVIRKAPRKGVRTRARGTVKNINTQISLHCQVYSNCRSRLIVLGADDATLQQYRELKKEDIKASTAILTPNTPGSTSLQLSWIWHDVTRHIIPGADVELPETDAATILECMHDLILTCVILTRIHA